LGGRDINYAKYRNTLVEAVTLEQVKAQARRLLAADKLIVVSAGKPVGL
jgi:predicted Zn-dependent peptidase